MSIPNEFEIAPDFTNSQWQSLLLAPEDHTSTDWKEAILVFVSRFEDRFFAACDELIEQGEKTKTANGYQRFGFAILAIDFLIIESLQGFREGCTDHKRKSKNLIKNFLKSWSTFKNALPAHKNDPEHWAFILFKNCRCALHHTASTDRNVTVGVSGNSLTFSEDKSVHINRTKFHLELKSEFQAYIRELQSVEGIQTRHNFIQKMKTICGE